MFQHLELPEHAPSGAVLCALRPCSHELQPPQCGHTAQLKALTRCARCALVQDLIDVGWTSVWVKVVTQWCIAGLYMWTMVAPSLFPDRDF